VLIASAFYAGAAFAEPVVDVAPAPPEAPPLVQVTLAPERPHVDLTRHMAGTSGDPVRAVENLPGVLRSPPDGDGVVVWGARADESRILVDGIEVPSLLHVGSQRSVIGVHAPGSVELVPGAYGADYGRALGGLVLITTRDLPTEGAHGAAEASFADASLLLAGAPTSRFRVGLSGTWSYADHAPDNFGDPVTTFYGPARYRDFQAKAELALTSQRRLTAMVLGAAEEVQPSNLALYQRTLRYPPHERTWYRVAVRYTDDRKNGTAVMPFVGWTLDDLNSPSGFLNERHLHTFHYGLRAQQQLWLGERAVLTASLDGSFERTRASHIGSVQFPRRPEDPDPVVDSNLVLSDWQSTVGDVAASLALDWRVGRWRLGPAFRADVFPTFVEGAGPAGHASPRHYPVALGPRLSVEYLPHPSVSLHVASGLYSQPASAGDLSPSIGNPALGPSRAAHARADVRWHVTAFTSVEAAGFLRHAWDIAVRGPVESAPDEPRLVSDGRARAYGAQLMVRRQVSERFDAWLAYTISHSEMRQSQNDPWTIAPYDRTHALTALFVHRWRGWLSSARFRYTSGWPYTPVENAVYSSSGDFYTPVYGARDSGRLRAFMQADLHLGRELHLGPGVGSVFFDITNVTSRENDEAVRSYSYDYGKHASISGPSRAYMLGARWQW
jgi:hypothetical protein